MGGSPSIKTRITGLSMQDLPFHTREAKRRTWANRLFALAYSCSILALFYRHFLHYVTTAAATPGLSLLMVFADFVLAFMWATNQGVRLRPIRRRVFPENLAKAVAEEKEKYPALDAFICTADPYKEPPMGVVNTALSVLAYDYPATEKLSVYLSDDGGSQLTLFTFMEAAKFARHWLPFCKKNNILERSPEAYFTISSSDSAWPSEDTDYNTIKLMYEKMKKRVENVVERGSIRRDDITNEEELRVFSKYWVDGFTPRHHPAVIQVLLDSSTDKDVEGQPMPNLVYVSREKTRDTIHNFKAGALNVLLRVSASMTNAPIVLILDCDTLSNDPKTPLAVLCYFMDPLMDSTLAFVQFPQRYHGLNKNDSYGAELKHHLQINQAGLDGFSGPTFMGTGCFFRRRALFGGPSSYVTPEMSEMSPDYPPNKKIQSEDVLSMAHHVAGCKYEVQTKWGSQVGFRYGSLLEDFYTGYRLHCEGWRSIFCHPQRPAFLGDAPMALAALLNQMKRWSIGLLDVAFGKHSPTTFGRRSLNFFQALCYINFCFSPTWFIPITIYAFLPPLALFDSIRIFPRMSDPWFPLYVFLFLGAYGQELLEFVLAGGTVQRWWSSQRMWILRALSSFPFGLVEYSLDSLGISSSGFNVTSKVADGDLSNRYDRGIFEFGVASPLFLTASTAAIVNLVSFVGGMLQVFKNVGSFEKMFPQIFLAGFAVVNSWPFYEAMALRKDKGRMPLQITLTSIFLACVLFLASSLAFSF